jgi:hypothetical protein
MDRFCYCRVPRDKYVERCKQRAFDYLDRGDFKTQFPPTRQRYERPSRL